jgi:ABC-2 type transport system permease protein
MNSALWSKSIRESRWLWLSCALVMFTFHMLFVWIMSQFPTSNFKAILAFVPSVMQKMFPVDIEQLASSAGRVATAYDHPIVLLMCLVWSVARGSDVVSGELGRGTLEMILAQPVSRARVLYGSTAVTLIGAAGLALLAWLGTTLALQLIELEEAVDAKLFVPAALSLFALMFFLTGITTLASAADRYRWRTIGIIGGFYAVESIVRIVAMLAPGWEWLSKFTFFTAFNPQAYVANPAMAWTFFEVLPGGAQRLGGLGGHTVLIGLGVVCFAAAGFIFSKRDLPAPL